MPADLPDEAWVVALARLPEVGPSRLRALLALDEPAAVWNRLLERTLDVSTLGRVVEPSALADRWLQVASALDVDGYWRAHVDAGVGVAVHGSPAFPALLAEDDDAPAVVFWSGDPDVLAGSAVAVVGTRRATQYGLDLANDLGRELAANGVAVVSGLARGIDAAAHAGVFDADGAPPIAVVGSGLDRVYPRDNAALWRRVAERGVVLSEHPLGTPPTAWQFPARNRIIAALSQVVVVVESQRTGGALGTALEAARRGRAVLSVPGPVGSPSSEGTNQLLFDGCGPARGVDDVLLALGREPTRRRATESRPPPNGTAADLLENIPWTPTPIERVVDATGLGVGDVMVALQSLSNDGWVSMRGSWVERLARAAKGNR